MSVRISLTGRAFRPGVLLRPVAFSALLLPSFHASPALAACSLATPCADTPIEVLPVPGGATTSAGLGISYDGSVAVGWTSGPTFSMHAYRWSSTGGTVDLGTLPGGNASMGYGVSGDGLVVVGFGDGVDSGGTGFVQHAMKWTSGGGMVDLGALPGHTESVATGVNEDGSVIIGVSGTVASGRYAVKWTSAGIEALDVLPGSIGSIAFDVSPSGSVIVGGSDSFGAPTHAVKWTSAGVEDIGGLFADSTSTAYSTSANGSVIVGFSGGTLVGGVPTFLQHATIWTSSGIQDLGTLGSSTDLSLATGVSDDGSVVVGYSNIGPAVVHAFRWTAATGLKDLNTLLTDAGVNMSGIVLVLGSGVSGNGQYLYGQGTFNGADRAYVVRYADSTTPVTGVTTTQSVNDSLNDLADAHAGAMAQQHAFAVPLLNDDKPMDNTTEAGIYASAGSAAAGGWARYATGSGLAVLAGVGYAREDYDNTTIDDSVMGALAVRYLVPSSKSWQPFIQGGGWWAPDADLDFERTYANGSGTATGVGSTNGDLGYVYGRAGVLLHFGRRDQLAVSAEIGREWLEVDAYSEALSPTNPFEAHVASGTDRMDIAKARVQWSFDITKRFDATVYVAGAYGFNRTTDILASVPGVGTFKATDEGELGWVEYGARVGYALTPSATLDVFANGESGNADSVDTRVHAGAGLRVRF